MSLYSCCERRSGPLLPKPPPGTAPPSYLWPVRSVFASIATDGQRRSSVLIHESLLQNLRTSQSCLPFQGTRYPRIIESTSEFPLCSKHVRALGSGSARAKHFSPAFISNISIFSPRPQSIFASSMKGNVVATSLSESFLSKGLVVSGIDFLT